MNDTFRDLKARVRRLDEVLSGGAAGNVDFAQALSQARRALRREKIWRPHREHFYQQAVREGASHARVSTSVLIVDGLLIGLAAAAVLGWEEPALAGAVLLVAALLIFLKGGAGRATGPVS